MGRTPPTGGGEHGSTDPGATEPAAGTDLAGIAASAVALLARRDFASGELADRLVAQGYESAAVAEVIESLIADRVLNDARYAENFIAYHANRGHGPLRIRQQLKELGVPGEMIQTALDAGPDWHERAREVRVRKFGPEVPEDWPTQSKQARFLQYRGFSTDHIRSALGRDVDS